MAGATPEATFTAACQAMERLDWETLFACLDPREVKKLARHSFSLFLMATGAEADAFLQICARHGVPQAAIAEVHARAWGAYEQAQEDALDAAAAEWRDGTGRFRQAQGRLVHPAPRAPAQMTSSSRG